MRHLVLLALCFAIDLGCWASNAQPGYAATAGLPLDAAIRSVDSAEDFSDYLAVAANAYANDIASAVDLGLVVGKYDAASTYFDPDTLVTTGEMVNILARNLGAASTVQGLDAVTYLGNLGVGVGAPLDLALAASELESLATQIDGLGLKAKANLVVLREALAGTLDGSAAGVTRAYAVAMYDEAVGMAPDPTLLPAPAAILPGSSATAAKTGPPDGDRVRPVFVLVD